jgi:hypothetical protein
MGGGKVGKGKRQKTPKAIKRPNLNPIFYKNNFLLVANFKLEIK